MHFTKDILKLGDLSYWSLRQVEGRPRGRFQKRRNVGLLALASRLPSAKRPGKAPLLRPASVPAVSSGASCPRRVLGALRDRLDSEAEPRGLGERARPLHFGLSGSVGRG